MQGKKGASSILSLKLLGTQKVCARYANRKKKAQKYKAAGIGTFEKLHLEDCQMRSINDERGESHFTMIQRLF